MSHHRPASEYTTDELSIGQQRSKERRTGTERDAQVAAVEAALRVQEATWPPHAAEPRGRSASRARGCAHDQQRRVEDACEQRSRYGEISETAQCSDGAMTARFIEHDARLGREELDARDVAALYGAEKKGKDSL